MSTTDFLKNLDEIPTAALRRIAQEARYEVEEREADPDFTADEEAGGLHYAQIGREQREMTRRYTAAGIITTPVARPVNLASLQVAIENRKAAGLW